MQPERKKMGRPTLYNPAYCDQVVELGTMGKSRAQIAAALDVDRITMHRWAEEWPDFRIALVRARELAKACWEDLGQSGVTMGSQFNSNYSSREGSR